MKNGADGIEYIVFTQYNNYSPRSLTIASKLARGDRIHVKYFKREQNRKNRFYMHSFVFTGSLLEED